MSIDQFLLSADTTDLNYPEVRPTLDLNFARTKTLDPRITFTRSSGGSYVGPDGLIKYAGVNEPRFDHDPVTGESLGLLIEESRQNLLLRSEEFDIGWSTSGLFVNKNQQHSPDGNFNGYQLITSNNVPLANAGLTRTISKSASVTTYTLSIFAKAFSFNRITLLSYESGNLENRAILDVNLSAGKFEIFPSALGTFSEASGGVIPYPNNWYRVFLTFKSGTEVNLVSRFNSRDSTSTVGDGTSGIYIWGAQLEQGSFPTSYIPTQGSTRTRAQDIPFILTENNNWYNPNEGTLLIDTFKGVPNPSSGFSATLVTSNENYIGLDYTSTDFLCGNSYWRNDPITAQIIALSPQRVYPSNGGKYVVAYKMNDFAATAVGGPVTEIRPTQPIPTATRLYLGGQSSSSFRRLKIHFKRATYFPKRLPNSQLQALTR